MYLLLVLFSFCWAALSNFDMIGFALFYYVWLFFSNERQKRREENGREGEVGRTDRSRGRGKYNQDIL